MSDPGLGDTGYDPDGLDDLAREVAADSELLGGPEPDEVPPEVDDARRCPTCGAFRSRSFLEA